MKTSKTTKTSKVQPSQSINLNLFVVFWLGLLTGAVVVGYLFFYQLLTPEAYQTSVLNWRSWFSSKSKVEQVVTPSQVPPVSKTDFEVPPTCPLECLNTLPDGVRGLRGGGEVVTPNTTTDALRGVVEPNMKDGLRGVVEPNM